MTEGAAQKAGNYVLEMREQRLYHENAREDDELGVEMQQRLVNFAKKWEHKNCSAGISRGYSFLGWTPNSDECPNRDGQNMVWKIGEGGQDCAKQVRDINFRLLNCRVGKWWAWKRGKWSGRLLGGPGKQHHRLRVPGAQTDFTVWSWKGGVWSDTRGMGITGDEVKALITQMKTLIDAAQQGNFDWNLPESDQGGFEFKMMALLMISVLGRGNACSLISNKCWTSDLWRLVAVMSGPLWKSRRTQDLGTRLGPHVISPKLRREPFDIRWVTTGIRIAFHGAPAGHPTAMSKFASIYDRVQLGG